MTSEKQHQYPESTMTSDATDDERFPLLHDDEESQLSAPPPRCPYICYTCFTDRILERVPPRCLPPLLIAFYVLGTYLIVSDVMVFRELWEKGA